MNKVGTKLNIALVIVCVVALIVVGSLIVQQPHQSLIKTPLKGCEIMYRINGDTETCIVIDDYWNACEHNPTQMHFVAIDYVNKTAYDYWREQNKNWQTRNNIELHKTLVWIPITDIIWVLA